MGKTRILQELQSQWSDEDLRWVWGPCDRLGVRAPWEPVRRLLALAAGVEAGQAEHERRERLNALGRREGLSADDLDAARVVLDLSPEDATWASLEGSERLQRLFAGLGGLALGLGDQRRTILVLDDLDEADGATMGWVEWLIAELLRQGGIGGNRVLVLATHGPELARVLPGGGRRRELVLDGLPSGEARTLLRELAGAPGSLPEGLLTRVVASAQGNPYHLGEALRLLVARGEARRAASGTLHLFVPESAVSFDENPLVWAVERVRTLERASLRVLQCLTVAGGEATDGALRSLLEEQAHWEGAVQALVDLDMAVRAELPDGPGLRLAHRLVGDAAAATLLGGERREIHGRLGALLVARREAGEAVAAEALAHHWGESDEPVRAVAPLREAAEGALRVASHEAAEGHLARLAEILTKHGGEIEGAAALRAWTALERGRLARLRGDLEGACVLLAEAVEAEMGTEPSTVTVQLVRGWGEAERQRGRTGDAIVLQRRAVALSTRLAPGDEARREEIQSRLALAVALRAAGEVGEALEVAQAAVAAAESLRDRSLLARGLNTAGICLMNLGRHRDALEPVERATAMWRERGDVRNLVAGLNNLGIVYERLVELDRALRAYGEALRVAHQIGHRRAVLANHINAGQVLQWLDNQSEAMRHFEQVIEACRERSDDVAQGLALVNLAWSRIHEGEDAAAERLLTQAQDLAERTRDHTLTVSALLLRSRVAWANRDFDEAEGAADEALSRIRSAGGGDELTAALRLRAKAESGQGRTATARRTLGEALTEARRSRERREEIQTHLVLAEIHPLARHPWRHARHLRRARRLLERFPVPLLRRLMAELAHPNR